MSFWALTIILAIICGQLIKVPIGDGGITILDSTIIILCLLGLLKIKFLLKKPPKFIFASFFFISISTLSLVLSPLNLSFEEYFISFSYIIRFSLYLLFSWLIYSDAFPKIKTEISNILIYCAIAIASIGLMQLVFLPDLNFLTKFGWDPHYFRTVSTFLDPNFVGAYFVLALILIKPGLHPKFILTKKALIFFAVCYIALLTTFSRSSYLMFLISGLTMSFLEKSKMLFIKVIVLFLILLLGFQLYTQIISKPRNIDRAQSASLRINTWQQGWQLFSSHSFLGIGFNAYRFGIREYQLGDDQFLQSHGASSNDSSLLFVLSTTGVIGLISYLYFLFSIAKYSPNKKATLPAVTGLLIHSTFANSLFFPPILLWLLFISINSKK